MRNTTLLGLGLLVAANAYADLGDIPKESGWSGFLLGGVNTLNYKSNFYSGDDNKEHIDSLGNADSNSTFSPLFDADIRYTFADTRTQVFWGT